jgi:hypothetical protein
MDFVDLRRMLSSLFDALFRIVVLALVGWVLWFVVSKRMVSRLFNTLIGFAVFVVVGLFLWFVFVLAVFSTPDRSPPEAMIPPTLKWGRLAPFPKSIQNFKIETEGNMFTREFNASFTAPAADVKRWLHESPGTRDVRPEETFKVMYYKIDPGGGAAFASVTVENGTLVRIRVYWS